jgi:mannose-6-phosphate isomerase-like protein (cupin superfamily)
MTVEKQDTSPIIDRRPWGSFTILDEAADYKVKRIEVFPTKRLSYQKHAHRSEHWFVVRGTAKVTLNGREFLLKKGEDVNVPVGTAHRVENPDSEELLIFIETQTGDYFGEDDIERLEDDFGRMEK